MCGFVHLFHGEAPTIAAENLVESGVNRTNWCVDDSFPLSSTDDFYATIRIVVGLHLDVLIAVQMREQLNVNPVESSFVDLFLYEAFHTDLSLAPVVVENDHQQPENATPRDQTRRKDSRRDKSIVVLK